jgi:large subunit ribosomal protein L21
MLSFYSPSIPLQAAQTGANNNFWLWIILFIVVVVAVWWLLTLATPHSGEGIEAHSDEHDHDSHEEPDDLAIIEGIGPKVKSLLREEGIATFSQLAAADVSNLEEILEDNKLQFLDPTSWPEQAKLASEGKMDDLQELMENLQGGRKVE